MEEFETRLDKVAIFSDGIQRMAMNMATNTAHTPFFTPFFKTLQGATYEQEDHLKVKLTQFLSSSAVDERTDDDKSLAFAQWVG